MSKERAEYDAQNHNALTFVHFIETVSLAGLRRVMQAAPKWKQLEDDQKECLEMVQHKVGKILNGDPNYYDSWHDIEGYIRLVAARLSRRALKESE